jgi:hypothetical protein
MSKIYEGPGELGMKFVAQMDRLTLEKIGSEGLANAARNRSAMHLGKSIAELRGAPVGQGDSAIIIAAGPSIARRNPMSAIKSSGYKGAIIATDSALYYCLRNGVVPDLVVTVDPQEGLIRWFGQPDLDEQELAKDDYWRRQDMDFAFADEMTTNREIMALLKQYGPRIKIALATCASKSLVDRVLQIGMQVYWWNPMFDDPDLPNSNTAALIEANGMPCINAGGNVGTSCYMMAHAVLEKRHVALTGVDFAYYPETPYFNTQYYRDLLDIVGEENLDSAYIRVFNPDLKKEFYTDPAYYWFREVFLELAADADCTTYNCTEGGILFGENIRSQPLQEFLEKTAVAPEEVR